jgi:hypothetical protein
MIRTDGCRGMRILGPTISTTEFASTTKRTSGEQIDHALKRIFTRSGSEGQVPAMFPTAR